MTLPRPLHPTLDPEEIEEWTRQTASALASFSITEPVPLIGAGVPLSIPLDEPVPPNAAAAAVAAASPPTDDATPRSTRVARSRPAGDLPSKELRRRDSLKRREALLRGKEGSRRRQRWENDHLLSNPHAQPPLPADWEVRPTHPVHHVPYYLAPLWDARYAARAAQRASADADHAADDAVGRVPRELRQKLKKAKGARTLLQTLEEDVRAFLRAWEARARRDAEEFGAVGDDDMEEDIVFVGRSGAMRDMPDPRVSESDEEVEPVRLVLEGRVDDQGAGFGRWLVHSIGAYYGLRTWSVTVGDPARREAYVGIKPGPWKPGADRARGTLPRPLWGLV